MFGRRGWMWLALGLAVVTGLSAGVIADRLALNERLHSDTSAPSSAFLWFSCDGSDVEQDPAYPYQPKHRAWLVDRLGKRLELDAEQVSELEGLLDARRGDARHFWSETRDAYCGMQTSFRDDIRSLLTPEQVETYERLLRRVDERHRQRVQGEGLHGPARRGGKDRSGRDPDECR